MTPDQIISHLGLRPHPEGGHYRETWRHDTKQGRAAGTCIYFLLQAGEVSRWHKVDATEIWHFYAGDPLLLSLSANKTGPACDHLLGPMLSNGQYPQLVIPPDHWQMARPTGAYTLVGCTVCPGFQFDGFTLADQGFDIPRG